MPAIGPAADVARAIVGTSARFAGHHEELIRCLANDRPRVVILGAPPAGSPDIESVAGERRRRPSLRAMLINEPGDAQMRLAALEAGFDEAMPSNLSRGELVGRARLLVAQRPRASTTLPIAEGLELDLAAQELRRNGVAVHLRPKELRLLSLLATHPGRVYTRRQLLERVWGPDVDSDSRTVDVHVRWLRSKIEVDPERPLHLVTVRGIGYRLDLANR
jgi:two-component system phosphate regulon response regulator PhoB